jgi:hypothetical protein
MNWNDNPYFPEVLNKERLHAKRSKTKEDYDNIWEGVCRALSSARSMPRRWRRWWSTSAV